ncbi:phosphatases II [Dichomitus squalens]|uniref:Phosphatases II n=1 Tax=Dichomitus squalens TaxID=114155 RepID=A0A4Q9PDD7_9APHY|nr:phosphatases II [Dichomitus squalens]TBU65350.1 phosphatases II [Dichomitus squalens]
MDALRVTKVEGVLCTKAGSTSSGTLHLTAHHAIFHFNEEGREEMWIPYPLISLVSRMPMTLYGRCPLTIHTRTFETILLSFSSEKDAIDVFESVKELTVATSINQLYAFFYVPNPPFAVSDGWSLYSPREEFGRMGVGTRSKAWRFTNINKDYSFSPTYPARLVVPTRISDTTLQYAVKFRSKGRLPVLTYLHWANFGSITRSSQPMVGLTNNRSIQDEKLIETIFQTHHNPDSRVSASPVYGATATNLIIDARPTTNAMANTAKGAGTENMDHYKDAKKAYLGIDHIHTMRESLNKVVEALRATELQQAAGTTVVEGSEDDQPLVVPVLDRQALRRSNWLRHITAILEGTLLIVRNVHINSSHVLIHCSDGWDRTAQLSSLAQLCLDPFYRTQKGFAILVEKDWLSFGHKFLDRCGHLSSEKFFLAPVENAGSGGGAEAAQAFLASVQNRFTSQHHIKETSPVFHQFLESVRQVQRQFPERFEFNERFLRQLHYHLYSCQFGTFLCNSERERRGGEGGQPPVINRTISVWDYFFSPSEIELNKNPLYDPSLDDPANRAPKADMGVLVPNPKDVRFWHELYGRTDEEMNGRFVVKQVVEDPEFVASIESAGDDPALSQSLESVTTSAPTPPPQPTSSPQISIPTPQSIARLLQRGNSTLLATDSPSSSTPPGDSPSSSQTQRIRGESLLPPSSPGASSSSIALGPPRTPSPSLRAGRSSPRPGLPSTVNGGDLFSSGGVRSFWGKVSSNATAAFSAVQDAYGGLAKDLKGISLAGDTNDTARGGELKSREEINAWGQGGDDSRPSSPLRQSAASPRAYTYSSGNTVNPWTTPSSRPAIPSMYMDNPWGSVRAPDREARPAASFASQETRQETSPLPVDPTIDLPIAFPHSRSNTVTQTQSTLDGGRAALFHATIDNPPAETGSGANADAERRSDPSAHAPSSSLPAQPADASTASSDPLGVAVWS